MTRKHRARLRRLLEAEKKIHSISDNGFSIFLILILVVLHSCKP